jgi:ferredoxin
MEAHGQHVAILKLLPEVLPPVHQCVVLPAPSSTCLCLLTQDHGQHVKFLKPSPVASPLVDHCIECGFCESNCPSRDLTLTPRQRITVFKEITRMRQKTNRTAEEEMRQGAVCMHVHLFALII